MSKESIGALWLKKINVKGQEVSILTGTVDGKKIVIYRNTYKTDAKHPDYRIYNDEYVKKEQKKEYKQDSSDGLPF